MAQNDETVKRNTSPAVNQKPKPSKRTAANQPAVIQKPVVFCEKRSLKSKYFMVVLPKCFRCESNARVLADLLVTG